MSIWEHRNQSMDVSLADFTSILCPFCQVTLQQLQSDSFQFGITMWNGAVFACPSCGWWRVLEAEAWIEDIDQIYITRGAVASLKELDVLDVSTPIEEVRAFLSAKYEERFRVHPRIFEETVASVFRDIGFNAEATSYSNDGGIDVILQNAQGNRIGVQVKRYKNSIAVEQIRALTGALVLGGFTKGVFVTTSDFQSGVSNAASESRRRGYPIHLINGQRFLRALRIAQRSMYKRIEDLDIELKNIKLTTLRAADGWGQSLPSDPNR